jgi:peptidyl-dipeptidase Dcp
MQQADNPFLTPSDLPYGLPPFDRIGVEHYLPAFRRGMADQRAEAAAIAADPEPPTFENTLVALERSGRLLDRVSPVFFNQASSATNPQVERVQEEVAPELAAHSDAIHLDPVLFARIDELHRNRDGLGLDAESLWLLERYHTDFVRAGARLAPADQDRLRALNEELSELSTRFQQYLLADTNASAVVVDDVRDLDGLTDDAVAAAAEAARARDLNGSYVLGLVLPTGQPALASLTDRALRERLFRASVNRGRNGNDHDTSALVLRMAALRAERAGLLGYADHAAYIVEDETARTTDAVTSMLTRLAPAAVANARAEAAELQTVMDDGVTLRAWDWAYYSERIRRERYEIDAATIRPYLELERVLWEGVFGAAGSLYGLRFSERDDLPRHHPDVRVFEVSEEDGSPLGLYVADFFARESKRGGAWMNSFVEQSELRATKPVVVNTCNIARPAAGEPTLLTFDEVRTLFHEFGHALHGLFSSVRYPRFSGTKVPSDFVEYPSQVNEMWALWPEIIARYAVHHRTGERMPQELVDRLLAARRFNQGFATTEYLAAALLDQAWHRLQPGDDPDEVEAFEAAALEKAGVALDTIPPRYRSTYFAHIFAGGYSAGYYSYIWSEVLDADTVDWFNENGGLRRENGDRFRREVLSKGGSVDPMEAFRAFRGREPRIEPLLERRGLTTS